MGQLVGQGESKSPFEPVSRFKRASVLVETGECLAQDSHAFVRRWSVRPGDVKQLHERGVTPASVSLVTTD